MQRDPLYRKRVVVLGFGRQGRALARWLPTLGASVVVTDKTAPDDMNGSLSAFGGVEFVFGGHPESLLDDADLVCVSGGVPLVLPFLQEAVQRNIPLSNDAQLFLERCPAPVVGITGSAGKTTTTTLVGDMLKRTDRKTWIGGNIGDVLLDVLAHIEPEDQVVMELSSFQLELMTVSPRIGAVLNITPNHLDRHGTMEMYTRAKAQILLHQPPEGIAILGRDDPAAASWRSSRRARWRGSAAATWCRMGPFWPGSACWWWVVPARMARRTWSASAATSTCGAITMC